MSDTFIPDPPQGGVQFIPDAPGAAPPQAVQFIPDQPQGAPVNPRGILARVQEGASQGYGEENTGPSDKAIEKAPFLGNRGVRAVLAAADSVIRAPGGAIGGAAGFAAGVAEKLGMSPAEADRLMRDLGIMGQGALVEGGMVRPRAGEPLKAKPVEAAAEAPKPAFIPDPPAPPAEGSIRYYHGTAYPDASGFSGETFVTPHFNYARDYHGGPNHVLYTDFTKAEAASRGLIDEVNGFPIHGPINDGAALLKPHTPKPGEALPPEPPKPPPIPEPTPAEMNTAQKAARGLKQIFTPEDVSPMSKGAGMDVRAASGKGARDTEVTRALFDEYAPRINKISDADRLALTDYIEGRSKDVPLADKTLQPFADVFRGEMKLREEKLKQLKSVTKEDFIEDYFPHMWKDPAKAEAFVRSYGGSGKQGSGASLKARTVPTIREGIEAGLEPVTTDPIQIGMKYVTSMDHFIGAQQILEKAKADGNVIYVRPKVMGASGNPESFKGPPPGWDALKGRGSVNAQGAQAYAPADYARIYNNYIDKGWNNSATWGPILDGVQRTSNAITSLKLGLSGFHAATMAKEAFASGIDRGVAQLFSGQPLKAATSFAVAPTKFIQNAQRGKQFKDVYLRKEEGTPQMREIVDLITEAGGRGAGNRHAADYRYSAMDSYWSAWKRGSLKAEIKAAAADSTKAYGLGSIKVLAQQVGRVMQTVAKPLFEHYIPALKNGAAFDMMAAWMDANPKATRAEQLKAARKVVDEVDNRFGEMIQDNIFWNKTMKQSLQTAMLSYSWFLGTARTIGGGTAALARNPARLSMKHPDWRPNANYALALPFVVATANAFYQYLKTGTTPDSVQDLMAPETGGMVKGVGTNNLVKERGQTPGYEKDVFGWLHSLKDEAFNKLSGVIQIPYAIARNKDWKDQPIRHSGAPAAEQVAQVLNYVYEQLKPISLSKLQEGQKKGSAITAKETMLGIKSAPSYLQDPEGSAKTDKYFSDKDWQRRLDWERSHKKNYMGPQ